jgi:hypothetical protein
VPAPEPQLLHLRLPLLDQVQEPAQAAVPQPEPLPLQLLRPPARAEGVRRGLLELLEKDDVTVEDLRGLDRISDLIYKEYLETGREDLIKYYYKLRACIALLTGLLRSKAGQGQPAEALAQAGKRA